MLAPKDVPVPAAKFQEFFGLSYADALSQNLVYNAIDACGYLGVDAMGLDALWGSAKKVKLGGGFYCGIIGCWLLVVELFEIIQFIHPLISVL